MGSAGNINIGAEASTTSNITIGRSGNGKDTSITGSTMTINPSVSCAINSGTVSVTGSPCNILTSTTGSINIGDLAGTTSGALGNIFMGNDANNLTSANNGIVQINKIRVGSIGTPYRCTIIGRNIGAGVSGLTMYTIPGAPTVYGLPIVVASINISSSTTFYMVMINPTTATQFTYVKKILTGGVVADASAESFNYVAYWL